jgi:hypothetical protein
MSGVPNVFGSATSSIPLSQLDVNFNTPVTIGNTTVGLGNTVTSFGNVTLTNTTISGLSGGSANGVVYINSSNVAVANPSVLDFDGNNLGIGTTTPDIFSRGYGKILGINDTTNNGSALQINSGTSAYPAIELGRGGVRKFVLDAQSSVCEIASLEAVPMTFSTNSTERMRIDSSGNLGLGVTPSAWQTSGGAKAMQVSGASLFSRSGITAVVATNAYYNTSNNWIYSSSSLGATQYEQFAGAHSWYNAPSGAAGNTVPFITAMTLSNAGTLTFGQSGQGIQFTNGSATVNSTLNDYETGTWTPSVGGTATYTIQNGVYTKIGNRVYFSLDIQINAIGTGSTTTITNLPFTIANIAGCGGGVSVGYYLSLATSITTLYANLNTNSTQIIFGYSNANGTGQSAYPGGVFGNSARIICNGHYQSTF